MVNINSSIAFVFALIILWSGFSALNYFAIKYRMKKKQRKQAILFQFPWYKKIFFLGLGDQSWKSITILSFCINVLFVILFGAAIWNIIDVNMITSYMIRFGGFILLMLILVRNFIVYRKI